eukprot:s2255_g6.t1
MVWVRHLLNLGVLYELGIISGTRGQQHVLDELAESTSRLCQETGPLCSHVEARSLASLETMEKALACLRMSNPELEAKYPSDAERHFEEIYVNVTKFVSMDLPPHAWSGYAGPWIENHWIQNFSQRWFHRAKGTKLRDIFGPFIPIFVPWVDLVVKNRGYPLGMMEMLRRGMRPDVLYVTVSQHDLGIFGSVEPSIPQMANLLVFSAGGNGHVPVPLLKEVKQPLPHIPIRSRRIFASFVGRAKTHAIVRSPMKTRMESWGNITGKEVFVSERMKDWTAVLHSSSLILVPRGWGRSSFRCSEMLQMGRVPVYLWDDIPWTFYPELWEKEVIGFSANINALEEVLDHIAGLGLEYLESMERHILEMRSSHFTYEGIMDQISKFMIGDSSDLRCIQYPKQPVLVMKIGPE